MDTKLITKLLLSPLPDDWRIAYSMIQNDADDFEFTWICCCLHLHTEHFIYPFVTNKIGLGTEAGLQEIESLGFLGNYNEHKVVTGDVLLNEIA